MLNIKRLIYHTFTTIISSTNNLAVCLKLSSFCSHRGLCPGRGLLSYTHSTFCFLIVLQVIEFSSEFYYLIFRFRIVLLDFRVSNSTTRFSSFEQYYSTFEFRIVLLDFRVSNSTTRFSSFQ
jgi:hypothetical protein